MNVTEAFSHINASFRGSDDDAPQSGPDYDLWMLQLNKKVQEWARDGKHTWNSLFSVNNAGTVAAGTQSYDLDELFLLPASSVKVRKADGSVEEFRIVEPQERDRFPHSVYFSGADPQTLTFTDTIKTDSTLVGGTIEVDGYVLPDALTRPSDTIPVDDPYWLVYAVASELAFNDESYDSKTGDLNAKANSLYGTMVNNNMRGTAGNPRTVRTNVQRIQDTRSEARSF